MPSSNDVKTDVGHNDTDQSFAAKVNAGWKEDKDESFEDASVKDEKDDNGLTISLVSLLFSFYHFMCQFFLKSLIFYPPEDWEPSL